MTPETPAPESPFVTIWEAPRATIRRVVDTDPRRAVNGLFFAMGAVGTLDGGAYLGAIGHPIPAAVLVVGVGLVTIPFAHLNAWYKCLVGRLLGGQATRVEVAAVAAWAAVPLVVGHTAIWLVRLALFGRDALAPESDAVPVMAAGLAATTLELGAVLFAVWSMVVSVVGFAEVNRFSILRSIATSVLAVAILATIAVAGVVALGLGPALLQYR